MVGSLMHALHDACVTCTCMHVFCAAKGNPWVSLGWISTANLGCAHNRVSLDLYVRAGGRAFSFV